eukprot:COSAG02_NODE_17447_length_1002_cov_2.107420_2_plen_97_part_00
MYLVVHKKLAVTRPLAFTLSLQSSAILTRLQSLDCRLEPGLLEEGHVCAQLLNLLVTAQPHVLHSHTKSTNLDKLELVRRQQLFFLSFVIHFTVAW